MKLIKILLTGSMLALCFMLTIPERANARVAVYVGYGGVHLSVGPRYNRHRRYYRPRYRIQRYHYRSRYYRKHRVRYYRKFRRYRYHRRYRNYIRIRYHRRRW